MSKNNIRIASSRIIYSKEGFSTETYGSFSLPALESCGYLISKNNWMYSWGLYCLRESNIGVLIYLSKYSRKIYIKAI